MNSLVFCIFFCLEYPISSSVVHRRVQPRTPCWAVDYWRGSTGQSDFADFWLKVRLESDNTGYRYIVLFIGSSSSAISSRALSLACKAQSIQTFVKRHFTSKLMNFLFPRPSLFTRWMRLDEAWSLKYIFTNGWPSFSHSSLWES